MYILIVNKKAGRSNGIELLKKLEHDPLYKKANCRTFLTEYPGHAEKIARQVAEMQKEQLKAIIVVGGDGTFHEVLNGLTPYPDIPLGFLPNGAGNDFARAINIKGKNEQIFHRILKSVRPASFWTGKYSTNYRNNRYARRFANSIGFGFDAEVVHQSNKGINKQQLGKFGLASFIYTVALIKTVRKFIPYTLKLDLDGEKQELENVWMVVVSNHPYIGGGMKINPRAKMASDKLGVLILRDIPKWKVLALFVSVFTGKHLYFKEVSVYKATNVEIHATEPIPYQVDGQAGMCKYCRISKDRQERKIFPSSNRQFT